jgi:serine/threonine protein kinase
MDRDRLRRLDALYPLVLERHPSERDAFVSVACAGDLELQREIQSLLKPECAESGGSPASETVRPLACGAALGPYRILELIGRGGMGEVYRAQDTRLERVVAIKLLRPGREHRQKWRQPLRREARATAALNHPHICSLYDIGEQDGADYLVMEYVEGETLARRLLRGPLPLEQVLEFGAQVADALRMATATASYTAISSLEI